MDANRLLDGLIGLLGQVYGRPWVAPFVMLPAMWAGAALVYVQARLRSRSFLQATDVRIRALRSALGSDRGAIAERSAFSQNFASVAQVMDSGGQALDGLIQAWREFQEQIIDETASPIRNTSRPDVFFRRAAPKQTLLVFWSNAFVAIGLILTFLGLIVALSKAAQGMQGGDVSAAQGALRGLLIVAGAKFFTSVGGLIASLALRFGEHGLTRQVVRRTDEMCALLERGLLYVPAQKLAVEQLDELREQSRELKTFNTDLALQIGERVGAQFQHAMAPVAESLSSLNAGMATMSEGLREGLGQSAADAVSAAASGELRALGQTLNALREQLESLGGHVGASGEDASRQIRAAGADFREAAENIRAAFEQLAGQVDGLGARMVEQGDAAARSQSEALERALGQLEAAQARSADAITGAVDALQGAGRAAATGLQQDLSSALTLGVKESQATFRHAVEESGEGLRSAAAGLARAVDEASGRVIDAAGLFQRGGESARAAADSMRGVADRAQEASTALGDASAGFSAAAAPVAQSAQAISSAADRMTKVVEAGRDAEADALRQVNALADSLRQTSSAADGAWRDYRGRFEDVDRSLGAVTVKLSETLGDSIGQFREFAQKVDSNLADAVGRLGASLTAIEDYAESLDAYVDSLDEPTLEAAE